MQKKRVKTSVLKSYEGFYTSIDKDTVQIIITETGLIAKPGHETVPLTPAGDNLFFIQPDKNMDIRFVFDKNKVIGFLFFGDRQMLYSKFR
jgi:hypothetical protein